MTVLVRLFFFHLSSFKAVLVLLVYLP